MLVAEFVFKRLQCIGEFNGTELTCPLHLYQHLSTTHCSGFFCHSLLLLPVARELYQMNAGSYLVTLLISCGPNLPCGCCSCDNGDEEEGEEGG